jgi:lysophospholipase L1-like esterase
MILKIFTVLLSLSVLTALPTAKKKVVFFGDSITQAGVSEKGYITKMQEIIEVEGLDQDVELIGEGIGGNKVYDLYLRMHDDVLSHNPDIVFIYIGVNDVWHKQSHGTGTDADKFVKFYQAIIDTFQTKSIDLILVTPGVIGEKTDFSNSLDGDLNEYGKAIKALAAKNGTDLIDLRGAMLAYNAKHNNNNAEKGILTADRVHLNEKGNEFTAELFWKVLKEKI